MNTTGLFKGRWSIFLLLAFWCVLGLAGESPAQLDPQKNTPYHLQIVLRVADHPPFTPAFKEQIKRELRAGLHDAFADLARVEVIASHPHLKEIENKGLQAALDSWKDISSTKTHFVSADSQHGQHKL